MFLSGLNSCCCFVTHLILHAFRQNVASPGHSASAARCRRFSGPRFLPRLRSMGTRGDPSAPAGQRNALGPIPGTFSQSGPSRKYSHWVLIHCAVTFPPRSGPCPGRGASRAWWGGQPCTQNLGAEMHWGCSWLPKPSFCSVAPPRVTSPFLWVGAFLPFPLTSVFGAIRPRWEGRATCR